MLQRYEVDAPLHQSLSERPDGRSPALELGIRRRERRILPLDFCSAAALWASRSMLAWVSSSSSSWSRVCSSATAVWTSFSCTISRSLHSSSWRTLACRPASAAVLSSAVYLSIYERRRVSETRTCGYE